MNKKSKYKYLAKNTGLLTISSFGSKILGFLLVPLYTNKLSTSDYGRVDLISTTVSFLIPILTINIASAVMRFSIDDPQKADSKLKYGAVFIFYSSLVLAAGLYIFSKINLVPWEWYYYIFLFLLFVFESYEGLFTQYLRGIDKVNIMVVSSLISTIVRLLFNIITLAILNWGVFGYLTAMLAGPAFSILYSFVIIRPVAIVKKSKIDYSNAIYKEMNKYAFVLGINAVGWTIATSLDKYILTWLKGVSENGIYSVSYKIPSIITVLCTIFSQAWSLSAIKEYNKEDEDGFFSKTFEMYSAGLCICCSALIILNIPLSRLMYAKGFFEAWKYTPTLILAMLFNGLSGFLASVFTAVKKNGILAISTMASAIINLILNFILIPQMGTLGAAIATAFSFFVVFIIRFWGSKKHIKYHISIVKDAIVFLLLFVQIVLSFYANKYLYIQGMILLCIIICHWISIKVVVANMSYMFKSIIGVFKNNDKTK